MGAGMSEVPPEWSALPELAEGTVQVFAVHAVPGSPLLAAAQTLLNASELERAARFRVELPRAEFIVGRALLRTLLSRATGTSPKLLPLQIDEFGKPFVPGVQSNVSHSRGLVYVALCRSGAVGVDVEWIDPLLEATELAEANFSPDEAALVAAAKPEVDQARVFCGLWTRKEAVVKAFGRGLHISLRDIVVPPAGRGTAYVTDPGTSFPARFDVQELPAPGGFAAALAVTDLSLNPVFSELHSK